MPIRVATWNMHGGVGLDGRFSPDRIGHVITELGADVVALQEFGFRRRGFDMRAHLERVTGWPVHAMATCADRHGDFGNALLTRFPIVSARCHTLGVERREPRNAIDVVLDCDGSPLRVIATHLGLRGFERRVQIARLLERFKDDDRHPVVLLGDFNVWRAEHPSLHPLVSQGPSRVTPATYPAPFPVVPLDRIFVSPTSACFNLHAHQSRAARYASDHLPLVADIVLP